MIYCYQKHTLLNCWFQAIDFTCVETQVGDGDSLDCEVVHLAKFPVVSVPDM
jgi:hypothetical protein